MHPAGGLHKSVGVNLHDWIDELCDVLDLETEVDEGLVLDLARVAAHNVERPAAPITTYLLGFAAGASDANPVQIEALAAKAQALAYFPRFVWQRCLVQMAGARGFQTGDRDIGLRVDVDCADRADSFQSGNGNIRRSCDGNSADRRRGLKARDRDVCFSNDSNRADRTCCSLARDNHRDRFAPSPLGPCSASPARDDRHGLLPL